MQEQKINDRTEEYWTGRAEDFSRRRMAEYDTPLREKLLDFLRTLQPERRGKRALDVGCGGGFLTLLLCELGFASVTAVDFSEGMVAETEKNCREKGFSSTAKCLQMDAQQLEFPEGSFDFVILRNVLLVTPEPARAYRELLRVLKPGGMLLNMDALYGRSWEKTERPAWDMACVWSLGVSELRCLRDLERRLDAAGLNLSPAEPPPGCKNELFALIAVK